jgi:hypothetical protein
MKNVCILFICFILCLSVFSQKQKTNTKDDSQEQDTDTDGSKNQFFGLRFYLPQGECVFDADGKNEKFVWSRRLRFRVFDETNDYIRIRFSKIWGDPNALKFITSRDKVGDSVIVKRENNPKYDTYINAENCDSLYYLFRDSKHAYTYRYTAWVTGVLVLPIKIRFPTGGQAIQAAPDVSIGPYFGYQWGTKAFSSKKEQTLSHTIAGFAAPGMISLNSSNSNDTTEKNSTNFGLSFGLGYLFQINKFQIGAFAGYDVIFGEPSRKWIYQPFDTNPIPWLSIGVGFNFRKDT